MQRGKRDLVDFQQDARLVVVVAVEVLAGAVKTRLRSQIVDLKVTELVVRVVDGVVTGAVYAANALRPVVVVYSTQLPAVRFTEYLTIYRKIIVSLS